MLITKTNPTGIDKTIQDAQTLIHDSLLTKWGIDTALYKSYGRAYRNKTKDGGYIAEVYTENGEYKEVYYDDTLAAISFFGINNRPIDQLQSKASIHLVFFVNLDKFDYTGRGDQEIRQTVFDTIDKGRYGMEYESTELWIENVLKEYPGTRQSEGMKYSDMYPKHCFRINYTIFYETTTCTPPKNF